MSPKHSPPRPGEDASMAILQVGLFMVALLLVGVAVVHATVLLRASRDAQAAADGAALAAVAAAQPQPSGSCRANAWRIAEAHDARLITSSCRGRRAEVQVGVPVASRLLRLLGVTEVRATSTARLVPDREPSPDELTR